MHISYFVYRNLEIFFRDKTAVGLSLLAEIIMMMLYILFMRDDFLSIFSEINDADKLMDVWMISGILGIAPVTAAMGMYAVMIGDKKGNKTKDFMISPVNRNEVLTGYIISASAVGILISLCILCTYEIYMLTEYSHTIESSMQFLLCLIAVLNSLSCSCIVFLPISLLKSSNALAGCCTVVGALIGFLAGIYIPIGAVDENTGMLMNCFPVSHSVYIFRQMLCIPIIDENTQISGEAAEEIIEYMGMTLYIDGEKQSELISMLILFVSAAACYICLISFHKFHKLFERFQQYSHR